MKLFNFQLTIPTGERAVTFTAPLTCDSIGVLLTHEALTGSDVEQRLSFYKQLLDSLGHLYHSAKVMTPDLSKKMLTVLDNIKAVEAPIFLEHDWRTSFQSTDDTLEFTFKIIEVNEQGIPIDGGMLNGSVEVTYHCDDIKHVARVGIKKWMPLDERANTFSKLFEGISHDDDSLIPWITQLDTIFARDGYPIVAHSQWGRHFSSNGATMEFKYIAPDVTLTTTA